MWLRPAVLSVAVALPLALAACGPGADGPLPKEGGAAALDAATAALEQAEGQSVEATAVEVAGAATPLTTGAGEQPVTGPEAVGGPTIGVEGEIVELEPSTHPLKGMPAPDLTMKLLSSDEEVSLSDYAGRPVLVNFWATWCVPCRVEMPWIQAAYEKLAARGLEVLSVDSGEQVPPSMAADTIARYVGSMGLTFPVLYGENTYDVQEAWTVEGLPVTFLVDPEGTVVDVRSGGYPNQATFENHLRLILPEE